MLIPFACLIYESWLFLSFKPSALPCRKINKHLAAPSNIECCAILIVKMYFLAKLTMGWKVRRCLFICVISYLWYPPFPMHDFYFIHVLYLLHDRLIKCEAIMHFIQVYKTFEFWLQLESLYQIETWLTNCSSST